MVPKLLEFVENNLEDIVRSFPEFETIRQDDGFENANFDPIVIDSPKRVIGFYNGQPIKHGNQEMILVSFLYIAPAYRKKGFARSTVKFLQDTLQCSILTYANNQSYNIFKGLGFKKVERITKMVWKYEE